VLEYGCPWECTANLLWHPVQRKLAEYQFMVKDDVGTKLQFKDIMSKHMGKYLFSSL